MTDSTAATLLAQAWRPASAAAMRAQRASRAQLGDWFEHTLRATSAAAARAPWREVGMTLGPVDVADTIYWLLAEGPGARHGRGLFLLRARAARDDAPLLLHAPHRFSDRRTGVIAAHLVGRRRPLLAAFNTVPRVWQGSTVGARNHDLYATALADAYARVYAQPWVLQLHGFDPGRRQTRAGRGAAGIVSTGTPAPTPQAHALRGCLSRWLPDVRLFGDDIDELGGTMNPVGRTLREVGADTFVHLELAADVRQRLATATSAARLAACLQVLR